MVSNSVQKFLSSIRSLSFRLSCFQVRKGLLLAVAESLDCIFFMMQSLPIYEVVLVRRGFRTVKITLRSVTYMKARRLFECSKHRRGYCVPIYFSKESSVLLEYWKFNQLCVRSVSHC